VLEAPWDRGTKARRAPGSRRCGATGPAWLRRAADQERHARQCGQLALVGAGGARGVQALREGHARGEHHVHALAHRTVPQRLRQMALADAAGSDDRPVVRAARIQVVIAPHHRWREGDYKGWKHMNPSQVRANQSQGFAAGSWGGEFHSKFGPQDGDVVALEHWAKSGFANTINRRPSSLPSRSRAPLIPRMKGIHLDLRGSRALTRSVCCPIVCRSFS